MASGKDPLSHSVDLPLFTGNARRYGFLACLLLFCLFLRLSFFVGIGLNDDIGYIHHARSVAEGINILANGGSQLAFRIGMVLPLALLYKIFGYSEAAFSSYPLMCSLFTCTFVYFVACILWGQRAAIIAALLWVVYPLQIVFDTQLSPSNQHAACVSAALFFFVAGIRTSSRETPKKLRPVLLVTSGAFLSAGWMVNELFVVMGIAALPVLIVLKPRPAAVAWCLLGLALLMFGDLVISRCASGSWLARVVAITETERVISSNTASGYLPRVLFKIRAIDPMHDEAHFGVLWYVFSFVTLLALLRRQWVALGLAVSVWLVLGYLQWGVVSLDGSPIARYIRYLSMIAPLQCLTISGVLGHQLEKTGRWGWAIYLLVGLLAFHLSLAGIHAARAARVKTNDFREMASFLSPLRQNGPVYMDETSAQFVELYARGQLDIERIEAHTGEPPPSHGHIVIDGSRGIVEIPEYRAAMSPWYRFPPSSWELLHVIRSNQPAEGFDEFDPKIYRITE